MLIDPSVLRPRLPWSSTDCLSGPPPLRRAAPATFVEDNLAISQFYGTRRAHQRACRRTIHKEREQPRRWLAKQLWSAVTGEGYTHLSFQLIARYPASRALPPFSVSPRTCSEILPLRSHARVVP